MTKFKLGPIEDDKPVKLTIELPASVHRDLVAYAELIGQEAGQAAIEPRRLIAPMIARFMATDRQFTKARRAMSAFAKTVDHASSRMKLMDKSQTD